MKLHVIAPFHTVPHPDYSTCPFSGKVLRFAAMMQPLGYEIIEYANEGSASEAHEKVELLSEKERRQLYDQHQREHPNTTAHVGSAMNQKYLKRLMPELKQRLDTDSIVCHFLGHATHPVVKSFPKACHLEASIGYVNVFAQFRVYMSYIWWHHHMAREKRSGSNYEWVIPNFYDLSEWTPQTEKTGDYILYFGRINKTKGLEIVNTLAQHTDREIVICGPGPADHFIDSKHTNVTIKESVTGPDRDELLGNARCIIMPTLYTEPFGNSGVEGMLCGTPVITSDFGAFSETVVQGISGFRCKTLGDWLHAFDTVENLDRKQIANYARSRFSMETIGPQYKRVFDQLCTLKDKGWETLEPTMAIPPPISEYLQPNPQPVS